MNNEVIEKTKDYVKEILKGDTSGHDIWHVLRVWSMAKYISKKEKANLFVVELVALLHDCADWKFKENLSTSSAKLASKWLQENGVNKRASDKACVTSFCFLNTKNE